MQAYWGASAIVKRIGLRDSTKIRTYIKRDGLPAFLRANPKRPCSRIYYSDEALIAGWLFAKVKDFRQVAIAEDEEKAAVKMAVQREREKKAVA